MRCPIEKGVPSRGRPLRLTGTSYQGYNTAVSAALRVTKRQAERGTCTYRVYLCVTGKATHPLRRTSKLFFSTNGRGSEGSIKLSDASRMARLLHEILPKPQFSLGVSPVPRRKWAPKSISCLGWYQYVRYVKLILVLI